MLISGVVCAAGGLLAALTIRNPARTPAAVVAAEEQEPTWHCGVSGPPLNPSLAAAGGPSGLTPTCGRHARRQR